MKVSVIRTELETIHFEVANFFDMNRNATIVTDSWYIATVWHGWLDTTYKCQPQQLETYLSAKCIDKNGQRLIDFFTSLPDSDCTNTSANFP